MTMNRIARALVALACAAACLAGAPAFGAPVLTGLSQFDINAAGTAIGGYYWNTLGGDGSWNAYVIDGGVGGAFLNSGNGGGTAIGIPLAPGQHTFTYHTDDAGFTNPYFGVNLYFDGHNVNPGISVYGARGTGAPNPPFAVIPATTATRALNGAGGIPSAGRLSFVDGDYRVTLSSFVVEGPGVYGVDRVADLGSSPNGRNDNVGQFTIDVTPTGTTTRIGTFTGGDPGEGLTLDRTVGHVRYAVNVRGPGGMTVQDAAFTADNAPGVTVTAQNEILNWLNPNYGNTPNDDGLEAVMQSIRWSGYPSTVSISLADLSPGRLYELDLLFGEGNYTRGFDVFIEGNLIVPNFSPNAYQHGDPNVGVVLSHRFIAPDDTLNIVLAGNGTFPDNNPIINGLVLLEIPEPASMVLLAAGGAGLLGYLRRRRR